jgi:hypothetical protein
MLKSPRWRCCSIFRTGCIANYQSIGAMRMNNLPNETLFALWYSIFISWWCTTRYAWSVLSLWWVHSIRGLRVLDPTLQAYHRDGDDDRLSHRSQLWTSCVAANIVPCCQSPSVSPFQPPSNDSQPSPIHRVSTMHCCPVFLDRPPFPQEFNCPKVLKAADCAIWNTPRLVRRNTSASPERTAPFHQHSLPTCRLADLPTCRFAVILLWGSDHIGAGDHTWYLP